MGGYKNQMIELEDYLHHKLRRDYEDDQLYQEAHRVEQEINYYIKQGWLTESEAEEMSLIDKYNWLENHTR